MYNHHMICMYCEQTITDNMEVILHTTTVARSITTICACMAQGYLSVFVFTSDKCEASDATHEMQTIWTSFTSSDELVASIDIAASLAPRAIVSARRGLKRFLIQHRSAASCSKGMKHALHSAIQSLGDGPPGA